MSLDLIALVVVLFFLVAGVWRGALASGAGLVSLGLAYTAAGMAARHAGPLSSRLPVPELLVPILAGSLAFALVYLLCGMTTLGLSIWDRRRRAGFPRSGVDRLGGACFGALRGAVVALLITVLATWLDAARDLGVVAGLDAAPQTEASLASALASRVIEGAGELLADEGAAGGTSATRVITRLVARPGESLANVKSLLEDERFQRLQQDTLFWTLVENGAAGRAVNQASVYDIVHDAGLRKRLGELGLVDGEVAEDPILFRQAMEKTLGELGPRLRGLRNDPEVRALAHDPAILQALESGDTFALLSHPGVRRVIARVGRQ